MNTEKKYYIAYGSNLNVKDMAKRCPGAVIAGAAQLRDHELLFRNHATVEPRPGSSVPVGVWEIQPEDEARMDLYEGYPHYYAKETMDVELESGTVSAMVYTMNPGHPAALPTPFYLQAIREGYESFGLDMTVLDNAMKRTWAMVQELEQSGPEDGGFPSMTL